MALSTLMHVQTAVTCCHIKLFNMQRISCKAGKTAILSSCGWQAEGRRVVWQFFWSNAIGVAAVLQSCIGCLFRPARMKILGHHVRHEPDSLCAPTIPHGTPPPCCCTFFSFLPLCKVTCQRSYLPAIQSHKLDDDQIACLTRLEQVLCMKLVLKHKQMGRFKIWLEIFMR